VPAAKKPVLTEVVISHNAGGGVNIRKYGDEKSSYGYFESRKYAFDGWTDDEVDAFIEEKRQELRERVDVIATVEHAERFDASYMTE
jgi:ferritin-like protein